jgi:hypothetical protein
VVFGGKHILAITMEKSLVATPTASLVPLPMSYVSLIQCFVTLTVVTSLYVVLNLKRMKFEHYIMRINDS